MTNKFLENIKQIEETYEYYKNIHNKLKYLKNIYILDYIYKDLNKNYSKAYLQGSDWYIGETLINNDSFIYPPNEFLIIYGFASQPSINKSRIILSTLSHYILDYKYQEDINRNDFTHSNYL